MVRILIAISFLFLKGIHGNAQLDTARIDSIVQKSVSSDAFEGTVLIADKGNIVYQESFGFNDSDNRTPVTNTSHFSIASVTKLFTAIAIMQLIEKDKFQLTDNLETLLPELDIPKGKKITVHHLLLHISGLPNENDAIYLKAKTPKVFISETLAQKGSRFGSFNYANIDYVLLGLLIEKYDKTSWEESIKNRILGPLKMENSGFLKKDVYPEDFAYPFSYNAEGKRQKDPLFFIENFYAAGCMYATSEDLLKLDQGLYGNQLLSEKSKELMYTSYPEYNYSGYSVWTYNYPFSESQPRIMERRGGILGANSVLIRMLDTNKTIIILSNNNKFNPDSFGNKESLKEALTIEVAK
ncbi:beta-lactamase family protein [Maribacter algarum]|uniref:Beta-lactamase family protein n=1 Tax=Maribacter algarum (ex Zhang et al. 2020) TaxID=2578118 RepID=A0A5S3PJR4_9FLAO|nr:serine hydrolase domain-containing protein [Maribacter algarum]TMM53721.1 beta-lactamase family protein [Maribacter algarum]